MLSSDYPPPDTKEDLDDPTDDHQQAAQVVAGRDLADIAARFARVDQPAEVAAAR